MKHAARSEALYVSDMVTSIDRARSYAEAGHDAFLATPLLQDAIVRNLEVICEAAYAGISQATARHIPKSSGT